MVQLNIRITESEKELLQDEARKRRMALSSYVRDRLFSGLNEYDV